MPSIRYHQLVIRDPESPPTPAEVGAIEKMIRATLPADFNKFLNAAHGGSIEYAIDVPLPDGTAQMQYSCIFSTRPPRGEAWGTFLYEIKMARQSIKTPVQVLPFAQDGGGSSVYLDLTKEGKGRVVAFVEGLPGWTGQSGTSQYVVIANSFDEYLSKLYIDKDYVEELIDSARRDEDEKEVRRIQNWLNFGMPDWKDRLGADIFTRPLPDIDEDPCDDDEGDDLDFNWNET